MGEIGKLIFYGENAKKLTDYIKTVICFDSEKKEMSLTKLCSIMLKKECVLGEKFIIEGRCHVEKEDDELFYWFQYHTIGRKTGKSDFIILKQIFPSAEIGLFIADIKANRFIAFNTKQKYYQFFDENGKAQADLCFPENKVLDVFNTLTNSNYTSISSMLKNCKYEDELVKEFSSKL